MTPLDPGILADVLEHRDEDGPRLVGADWWSENGEEERAEFVRVQVALALSCRWCKARQTWHDKPPIPPDWPARAEPCKKHRALRRRERELLPAIHNETLRQWTLSKPRVPLAARISLEFRRGFVHSLICTAADWLANADAILSQQPVQAVTLTTWPEIEESTMGRLFPNGQPEGYHERRRLSGKSWRTWEELGKPKNDEACMLALLAAEWDRIAFTLPQVVDFSNFAIDPPALPVAATEIVTLNGETFPVQV